MKNLCPAIPFRQSRLIQSTAFSVLLLALLLFTAISSRAAPGDLDTAFGSGGKVTTPVGAGRDLAQAVALQPDGKIIVAGYAQSDFALVRYHPDGSLDTAFGTNGKAITPVGVATDEAYAVAVQPDGKIVLAGRASTGFGLVRYLPNGSLDTSFGTGGKVITQISGLSIAEAVAVQSDGKIVLAGWSGDFPSRYAVLRYDSGGSLDSSFGVGGRVLLTVGTNNNQGGQAHAMVLQPDGKVIVAGGASVDVGQIAPSRFSLLRLTAAGALDDTFGAGGKVTTAVTSDGSSMIYDVALLSDGKIVASGESSAPASGDTDTAVVRYFPDGSLDTAFGTGGKVITRVGTIASSGEAVGIQTNGKIVVAGSSFSGTGAGSNDFGALRLNADGSLDSSFGTGGKVITQIGSRDDLVRDAVVQSDGKIVVIGHSENASAGFNEDFALVRYLGDAATARRPLFDFDGDGKTDYGVFRPSTGVWYLQNSQSGFSASAFGFSSDKLAPSDYDGDGRTDVAVFRPSTGTWYVQRSQAGFTGIQFGQSGDVPVPADYSGDGKAEIAVFRPSSGIWYQYNLASNQTSAFSFGMSGDVPTAADFDGDGKTDVAVFRPANGTWYVQRSQLGFTAAAFGQNGDKPTASDFNGDGRADFAVARQSGGVTVWYILGSSGGFFAAQFGSDSDKLAAGDYDGDGKTDLAVWRTSNGAFYVLKSNGNVFSAFQFGQSGDAPVASSFIP
jgi:uncharacterized delta-60 repeat protein